ncbi:GtrA family protein [Cellulomonas hominis]
MTDLAPASSRTLAVRARLAELTRFGTVGAVSFVVDMGTFNLLRFGPGELLEHKPLTARVIAVLAATLVSWLGNRFWTFAEHRTGRQGRELALYAAINLVGIGITVGTLAFSHYVLDLRTPLADNVANVVGIALGTVVRYFGYKALVFTGAAAPTDVREAVTVL